MIAKLALRFWIVFALVLLALSAGAYEFVASVYAGMLQPALATPEGAAGFRAAMLGVLRTIVLLDVPLLALIGAAAWVLARAALEPLLQARERERAFAADAAHELRSPLATIASVAQAAAAQAPEQERTAFATIARAALDASDIVGELLTLARVAGGDVISCEPVDLGAVASAVAKEFAPVAQGRGVVLDMKTQSAIVNGDERRLRELLRNLLENAVRHARSTVCVATAPNGRRVDLVVSNDGAPIDPGLREKIFERFFRAVPGDSGSGLGLAIVAWIAHAHGGEAFVRDAQPAGAEFVVRLPALDV